MVDRAELLAEAQRRGLVPSQQPSRDDLMAEAQRRGLIQQPPESIFSGSAQAQMPQARPMDKMEAIKQGVEIIRSGKVMETVSNAADQLTKAAQGNAEFKDAGSFEDWQWTQPKFGLNMNNLKTTAAGMFGTDKDKFDSFRRNNPDVQIKMDNAQNPYFEDKGKKFYLDMPGLDAGDFADFAGEGGTYALAGGVTAPLIKGTALAVKAPWLANTLASGLSRTAAVSGGQGLANIANQKLAGRDEVDYGETLGVMASAGLFDQGGQLVNKIRNARAGNNNLTGNKKLAVDYANKKGLYLGIDDVSDNALVRGTGQQIDNMPFIGGGKDRQLQNLAQRAEAERVTKSFALPDTEMDDLFSITSQGMKNQLKKSKEIASKKYEIVNKKLNAELGQFDVPNLKRKANEIIQEQLKKGSAADQNVIKEMQKYTDIPEGDFSHWSSIRSDIIGDVADAEKSLSQTSGSVTGALKRISGTINTTMDDVANKSTDVLRKEWRDANSFYKNEVGKYKKGELRKLVNDENPEKILQILTMKGGADATTSKFRANRIYNSLDENGKIAARGAMMQKAFKEAITEVDDFSPAKYATMLENYSKRLGIMLTPEDKKSIDGLTAYMRMTQAAGNFGRNTPTGQQAVPAIYGLTAGAGAMSNPGLTAVGAGAVYSLRKLFRTKRGRSFMLAMANYPEGKKPPPELLTSIARYLAVRPSEEE